MQVKEVREASSVVLGKWKMRGGGGSAVEIEERFFIDLFERGKGNGVKMKSKYQKYMALPRNGAYICIEAAPHNLSSK